MKRTLGLLCISAAAILADAGVSAQIPPPTALSASAPAACPRGRLSIYFASGDVSASPQAQLLLGRIGESATSCAPDGIDLVARIDSKVDGDQAVAMALARLRNVADDLVARGLPAERIRMAAQASNGDSAPGINQIDVLFRKAGQVADDAVEQAPAPARTAPSDAI